MLATRPGSAQKLELGILEDGEYWPQSIRPASFFEMWLRGENVLALGEFEILERPGINPFTREPMVFRTRKRLR